MKLAIVNLTSGNLSGGYRKYLTVLPPLLLQNKKITTVRTYVPDGVKLSSDIPLIHYTPEHYFSNGHKSIAQDLSIYEPDVIFVPTARRFRYGNIPVVNMIRNMEPLETPYGKNPKIEMVKNYFRAREARLASVQASRIIAVSDHVKNFLINNWALTPDKIGVVYHGINSQIKSTSDATKPISARDNKQFLFTAGSIRPARGLEDLIIALPQVLIDHPELHLMIAGGVDPGMNAYHGYLKDLAEKHSISNHLIWAGHLNRNEMAWCFQNSMAFVMTSRAEACPNTVLEAMSSGAVSISTDKSPMPEFYRDTALYYKGGDAGSLTNAITKVLKMEDSSLKKHSASAKKRAEEFTWKTCADNTVKELNRVFKNSQ